MLFIATEVDPRRDWEWQYKFFVEGCNRVKSSSFTLGRQNKFYLNLFVQQTAVWMYL